MPIKEKIMREKYESKIKLKDETILKYSKTIKDLQKQLIPEVDALKNA